MKFIATLSELARNAAYVLLLAFVGCIVTFYFLHIAWYLVGATCTLAGFSACLYALGYMFGIESGHQMKHTTYINRNDAEKEA